MGFVFLIEFHEDGLADVSEAARLLTLLEYNLDKFLHHALDIFAC